MSSRGASGSIRVKGASGSHLKTYLTSALTATDSRTSYAALWYDGIGRQTAEQVFGAIASRPFRRSSPGYQANERHPERLQDFHACTFPTSGMAPSGRNMGIGGGRSPRAPSRSIQFLEPVLAVVFHRIRLRVHQYADTTDAVGHFMCQQQNGPQKLPPNSLLSPSLIDRKPRKSQHGERVVRKPSAQFFGNVVDVD